MSEWLYNLCSLILAIIAGIATALICMIIFMIGSAVYKYGFEKCKQELLEFIAFQKQMRRDVKATKKELKELEDRLENYRFTSTEMEWIRTVCESIIKMNKDRWNFREELARREENNPFDE
jgi:Na+-translocating ferredoxin:NAD+ oxidoreductase RnfG subunit